MRGLQSSIAACAALAIVGGDVAVAKSSSATPSSSSAASGPTGLTYPSGFNMKRSWGNLSPYQDADGFGVPDGAPQGCELSQVHVLHRHAQRYPTDYPLDGGAMEDFHSKIANYTKAHPNKEVGKGPLSFLKDWEYLLGEELLLVTGAATEASSGASIWAKYGRALYHAPPGVASWNKSLNVYPNGTARPMPVFRTTSQARILESARWWLSGFFGDIGAEPSYDQYDLVIIPETKQFNNTLASYEACSIHEDEGDKASQVFIDNFIGNAKARLQRFLPSDLKLSNLDVYAMMNICPYEFATLGSSAFCALFTEQEWRDFEYIIDIQFYGNYGFGAPTGRAQGIGYVEELAARLKAKLIYSSDSSINYTYDNNIEQFPLHQPLYMDMSHDDIIVSVTAALGMDYFKYGPHGLPSDVNTPPKRNFHLNQITPFGARFISEVWTCPKEHKSFDKLQATLYKNPDLSSNKDTTDYIRFLVNEAPLPLKGVPGCEKSQNGFCGVKDFLSGVPKSVDAADYQYACFANYTSSGQVGNGRPE